MTGRLVATGTVAESAAPIIEYLPVTSIAGPRPPSGILRWRGTRGSEGAREVPVRQSAPRFTLPEANGLMQAGLLNEPDDPITIVVFAA